MLVPLVQPFWAGKGTEALMTRFQCLERRRKLLSVQGRQYSTAYPLMDRRHRRPCRYFQQSPIRWKYPGEYSHTSAYNGGIASLEAMGMKIPFLPSWEPFLWPSR